MDENTLENIKADLEEKLLLLLNVNNIIYLPKDSFYQKGNIIVDSDKLKWAKGTCVIPYKKKNKKGEIQTNNYKIAYNYSFNLKINGAFYDFSIVE
ncbi:MAG: hypothetical protein ACOCRX_00885 [Candidatus Woesearchaeota archaeon]